MSSYGSLSISTSSQPTYSSSDAFFAPTNTTPTDIWTIAGSSTKTIEILYIGITTKLVSAIGFRPFYLLRRSSANSGGTTGTTTAQKLDPNNAAPTATITYYTANASSLGTLVGQLAVAPIGGFSEGSSQNYVPAPHPDCPIWNASALLNGQPLILRGTTDILAVNLNSYVGGLQSNTVSIRCVFREV